MRSQISEINQVRRAKILPESVVLYLDYLEAAGRSPQTLYCYRRVFLRLFELTGGRVPDSLAVRDFLDSISNNNSRGHALVTIRQWLKFLRSRGLMTEDPSAGIPMPKPHRKAYAPVSEGEFHGLLSALKDDPQMQTLATVLYYVGSRISETCRIRVEHVSFNGDCGTIEFPHRKGGDAGFAAFGPEVSAVLRPHLSGKNAWIFPNPADWSKPVSRAAAAQRLVRAGRKAEIPGTVNPHRLRHSYIIKSVESGVWSQLALQRQVGHNNPSSTAWYYRPTRNGLLSMVRRLAEPAAPPLGTHVEAPLVAPGALIDTLRTQLQFLVESQGKILELLGRVVAETPVFPPAPPPAPPPVSLHLPEHLQGLQHLLHRLARLTEEG